MKLYGKLKSEEATKVLFVGGNCDDAANRLNLNCFDQLTICEDDGVIAERIVDVGSKFFRLRDYIEKYPEKEVVLAARRSMDEYDSNYNPFLKCKLKHIPEEWQDKFILNYRRGEDLQEEFDRLDIYAPRMMSADLIERGTEEESGLNYAVMLADVEIAWFADRSDALDFLDFKIHKTVNEWFDAWCNYYLAKHSLTKPGDIPFEESLQKLNEMEATARAAVTITKNKID